MRFFSTRLGQAVKRMIIACVQSFLRLFYFLPINDRRILFSSFNGEEYSGNPRCVSDYLAARGGQSPELVWGFVHPKRYRDVPGIRPVRIYSPRWFYYALTAAVYVMDVEYSRPHPKRRGQFFLNTWHGGGAYKRVGPECFDRSKAERRARYEAVQRADIFLSSSECFTRLALRQDMGYKGAVLNTGMPRNDIFFSPERRERAAEKVRRTLGLEGYVALYAPTFRGPSVWGKIDYHFPYEQALAGLRERFGGPVTILKRAHLGCVMVDGTPDGVMDVSDWPDMQELLCAADMLITDYSSSMWDFALLGRPCLLYQTDLEDYVRERGICTPVEQWPGIVCRSDGELLDAIRTLDERACAEKAGEHLRAFGSYEAGTATEQAARWIMDHIEGRQKIPQDRAQRE